MQVFPNFSLTELLEYFHRMSMLMQGICVYSKSLYISRVVSDFHGTEFVIWADFGPVGSTEKKIFKIVLEIHM